MIHAITMYQVRCNASDCDAQSSPDMGFLDMAVAEADAEDNGWQIVDMARPGTRGTHLCPEHRTETKEVSPSNDSGEYERWADQILGNR